MVSDTPSAVMASPALLRFGVSLLCAHLGVVGRYILSCLPGGTGHLYRENGVGACNTFNSPMGDENASPSFSASTLAGEEDRSTN